MRLNLNGTQIDISGVLIDMDGTITDSMPWHYRAWSEIFKRWGICIDEKEIYLREGEKDIVTLNEIFKNNDKSISPEESLKFIIEKETLFNEIADIKIYKGVRRFLKKLKDKGIKLALVTGTSYSEMYHLLPGKISRLFDHIVTGNSVKIGKPDPEPYLKALHSLRLQSKDVIVIENAPLGIKSARNAGLFTIALQTSLPAKYLKDADIVISNHKELYSLFNSR